MVDVGQTVLVFDPQIWGGRDRGDNSHCWMPATVLTIVMLNGEPTYTVRFHHDDRLSRGHFFGAIKKVSANG